jgi:hypothetical protein
MFAYRAVHDMTRIRPSILARGHTRQANPAHLCRHPPAYINHISSPFVQAEDPPRTGRLLHHPLPHLEAS